MRETTPRLIATFLISSLLLLGIGMGVAEAHVRQLEEDAMQRFTAESVTSPTLAPEALKTQAAEKVALPQPYFIETTVRTDQFVELREIYVQSKSER